MLKVRSSITLIGSIVFIIVNLVDLRKSRRVDKKPISSRLKVTLIVLRLATFGFLLMALVLTVFMKFIIILENWALSG